MNYPQILSKTSLKLKVTNIILVMRQDFLQEILKQTISYMALKIWDLAPKDMKQVTTLNDFKAKISLLGL